MKTSEVETFCPYPGLRSFTEEESLYFKGRDEQIDQVSNLLEKNKFLMVTGASGEGKSSLIYAGLIPNARAGFFKARYTNWLVADFRPERAPLHNMAAAVGLALEKESPSVETELRRGFSSLVDLYKNSRYYVEGKDLSLPEKRQAANLLIIIDQFEEFFTNPENYFNEAASVDSQTVVNLALETARIALRDNLPVYVICTMRSDYIGQCSAFRGLPEYIGFSQFFVPRLKRKDLIQVIEEPAVLSGNRITRRLVERLVYDLADGIDQLPILQHALSQVWHAADQGRGEMDLLQYAKVGGMPAGELPEEQQVQFNTWFEALPERRQKSFRHTGLNRVIEIHADRLYDSSWEGYDKAHPDRPLTEKGAKFILALTFACLTRIDHSRAVRNRMTLREITAIINKPHLTEDVVAEIIRPYRLEENAFVRPFAADAGHEIAGETVLDITHESLIRNWGRLKKWADQEFEYYTTLLDFRKQLARWNEHNRSSGFLLPIGPLTYYENWIAKSNPNPAWINRYSEQKDDPEKSVADSRVLFDNMQQFVRASARKVWVTRAWMKYGTFRLATLVAVAVMLVMSGYYLYDANRKRNEAVIASLRDLAAQRLLSIEVNVGVKQNYLVEAERYEPGAFFRGLATIPTGKERIEILMSFMRDFTFLPPGRKVEMRGKVLQTLTDELTRFGTEGTDRVFYMHQRNHLLSMLITEDYYHPDAGIGPLLNSLVADVPGDVKWFYSDVTRFESGATTEINYSIHLWLTLTRPGVEEIQQLISLISPPSSVFDTYYRTEIDERNGRFPLRNGGGYHLLASLQAALGNAGEVLRYFEKLKQDPNYFTSSPQAPGLFNNYNQVIGYLYHFGHRDKTPAILAWLAKNYETNPPQTVLRNAVIRGGYLFRLYYGNFIPNAFRAHQGYAQPVLSLLNREVYAQMCDDLLREISRLPDANERNYLTAMQLKRQAVMTNKYNFDRKLPQDTAALHGLLERAWEHFANVEEGYLIEIATLNYPYLNDGIRNHRWPRKWFFIYPDYMDGWFANTFHSDLFFNHADKTGRLGTQFKTLDELNLLHYWISNSNMFKILDSEGTNYYELPASTLERVLQVVDQHPLGKEFDCNLPALMLANRYFEGGDTTNGMRCTQLYAPGQFLRSVSKYEYTEKGWLTNLVLQLSAHLACAGNPDEAKTVAESLDRKIDLFYAYWYSAVELYKQDYDPASFIYLDSALSKAKPLVPEQLQGALDFRDELLYTYGMIGGSALSQTALELIRDLPDGGAKFNGMLFYYGGQIQNDNYFQAFDAMPADLTEQQELRYCQVLLNQICEHREKLAGDTQWDFLHLRFLIDFYPN